MPFDLTLSPDLLKKKFHDERVLLIPFEGDVFDVVKKRLINLAYFLPVGVLIGGLHATWPGRGRWAGLQVFAVGLAVAGSIEFMQLDRADAAFSTSPTSSPGVLRSLSAGS